MSMPGIGQKYSVRLKYRSTSVEVLARREDRSYDAHVVAVTYLGSNMELNTTDVVVTYLWGDDVEADFVGNFLTVFELTNPLVGAPMDDLRDRIRDGINDIAAGRTMSLEDALNYLGVSSE